MLSQNSQNSGQPSNSVILQGEKIVPWTSANSCHLYHSSASCLEKFKESQMIVIRSHWQTFLELSGPDQWCSGGGDACKNRWKWSLAHTLKGEITLSNGNVETFSIWLSII